MKELTESDVFKCAAAYHVAFNCWPTAIRMSPATIRRLAFQGTRDTGPDVPFVPDPRCPPETCYALDREIL